MKLLILTQYYPPEIGAPQNRLHELAVRLKAKGVEVEVLTALPNYPTMEIKEAYKKGANREEIIDGIPVHRASIYVSKSKGVIKRLLNYFSFVWTSFWRGRKLDKFDFLMVESPPLFLGYSAMALSKKLNAKLIFNVSDLWPESAEKLEIVNNKSLLKMAYNLERKCYLRATVVTGQTSGIVQNINDRFKSVDTFWLPNGVDVEFYNPDTIKAENFRQEIGANEADVIFFYGGIIGHAQGLNTVLEAADLLRDESNVKIVLQGDGPVKKELLQMADGLNLNNVIFRDPVSKDKMPAILKSVDVALVPLRKLDLFAGAIPSKIFEAQAMKLPLVLGVDGEARQHFIENAKSGLFYEPENAKSMAESIKFLAQNKNDRKEMGERARAYVSENFNRNQIAEGFLNKLKEI